MLNWKEIGNIQKRDQDAANELLDQLGRLVPRFSRLRLPFSLLARQEALQRKRRARVGYLLVDDSRSAEADRTLRNSGSLVLWSDLRISLVAYSYNKMKAV